MIDGEIVLDGRVCRLEVTEPMGTGGGYHVFVDRFFQGKIVLNNGIWRMHLNDGSVLTEAYREWVMGRVLGASSTTPGAKGADPSSTRRGIE